MKILLIAILLYVSIMLLGCWLIYLILTKVLGISVSYKMIVALVVALSIAKKLIFGK